MANKKAKNNKPQNIDGFYKGYNIEWLRKVRNEHPDGHLVQEFDNKNK